MSSGQRRFLRAVPYVGMHLDLLLLYIWPWLTGNWQAQLSGQRQGLWPTHIRLGPERWYRRIVWADQSDDNPPTYSGWRMQLQHLTWQTSHQPWEWGIMGCFLCRQYYDAHTSRRYLLPEERTHSQTDYKNKLKLCWIPTRCTRIPCDSVLCSNLKKQVLMQHTKACRACMLCLTAQLVWHWQMLSGWRVASQINHTLFALR